MSKRQGSGVGGQGSAPRRIAVAITGASGVIYGLRLLEELLRDETIEVHLAISPSAQKVLAIENNIHIDSLHFDCAALGLKKSRRLIYHPCDDIGASIASGSFRVEAMAIVPCSMGCAGAIAHGISDDLIQRAADVMIKERRRLVIVPRETPLSSLHLENLLTLSKLGVIVLPASPGFYHRPKGVPDLVNFVVARVLDHLQVENQLSARWGDAKPS